MTTTRTTAQSPQGAFLSAVVTAATIFVVGVLQVVHEPSGPDTVVGIEHVIIGGLTAYLLAQLPALWWLARGVPRRWPVLLAGTGMAALAALAATSNVLGHDLGVFEWIALPANLFWFAGLIALAVATRTGTDPRWTTLLLPLTWVGAIPLSSLGGGVLVAGYFAALARHLHLEGNRS